VLPGVAGQLAGAGPQAFLDRAGPEHGLGVQREPPPCLGVEHGQEGWGVDNVNRRTAEVTTFSGG
jgi:hypothetical protein